MAVNAGGCERGMFCLWSKNSGFKVNEIIFNQIFWCCLLILLM